MSLSGIFPIERWNFSTQSVLNALSEEDYTFLISSRARHKYKKGEDVFKEGMLPSGIFFIHSGKIKKYKIDETGREQIIYVANGGELIGYHAVLSEERYSDSAVALEASEITFIPRNDFLHLLNKSPLFAQALLKALSHEFAVLANNISVFTQRSAVERLAIALIVVREKYRRETPEGQEITIDISRNDLANIVGIAKENVIRLLKGFKTEGIIETHGRKIRVKDIKKLVERSNYR